MVREGRHWLNRTQEIATKAGIVPGDEVLKWKLRRWRKVAGMLWGHSTW